MAIQTILAINGGIHINSPPESAGPVPASLHLLLRWKGLLMAKRLLDGLLPGLRGSHAITFSPAPPQRQADDGSNHHGINKRNRP